VSRDSSVVDNAGPSAMVTRKSNAFSFDRLKATIAGLSRGPASV
jgi:hypothetical protein